MGNYASQIIQGSSWPSSYGSWIYSYKCNQCLSPQKLLVRTPFVARRTDTTLCDQLCQWLVSNRWLSPGTLVSSTNKLDRHDITELLLKVALNTINHSCIHRGYAYDYIWTNLCTCQAEELSNIYLQLHNQIIIDKRWH